MKKLYRITYIAKEEGTENYYSKDSWMVESELEVIDIYNKLEEWNNQIGPDKRLVVDEEKNPIAFDDFYKNFTLDQIKK